MGAKNPAPRSSIREPYGFYFNFSRDWANSDEFPIEAAFANFLYWHTAEDDTIVTYPRLGESDLFGLVALYMKRRLHSLVETSERARHCKANTTLGYIAHPANDSFWSGYASWPKMMVCVTFARNVADLEDVDAFAFLHAQTAKLADRIVRDKAFFADVKVLTQHVLRMICMRLLSRSILHFVSFCHANTHIVAGSSSRAGVHTTTWFCQRDRQGRLGHRG